LDAITLQKKEKNNEEVFTISKPLRARSRPDRRKATSYQLKQSEEGQGDERLRSAFRQLKRNAAPGVASGSKRRSKAGGLPVVEYTGPGAGKWAFEGNDNKGHVWKGSLTISVREGEHLCVMSMQVVPDGEGRGIDGTCKWSPDKRELSFGRKLATFTAILSADGIGMTNGTWTESEENEKTRKATVKRTGTWSATYAGGQANQ
jgi:hypothetical protein